MGTYLHRIPNHPVPRPPCFRKEAKARSWGPALHSEGVTAEKKFEKRKCDFYYIDYFQNLNKFFSDSFILEKTIRYILVVFLSLYRRNFGDNLVYAIEI